MSFTHIKDLNMKILSYLDEVDLGKTFQLNKASRELSRNETFWFNRCLEKWGKYFNIKYYKNFYSYKTWREYYQSIYITTKKIYNSKTINHTYDFENDSTTYYLSEVFGEIRNAYIIKRKDIIILMEERLIREKLTNSF